MIQPKTWTLIGTLDFQIILTGWNTGSDCLLGRKFQTLTREDLMNPVSASSHLAYVNSWKFSKTVNRAAGSSISSSPKFLQNRKFKSTWPHLLCELSHPIIWKEILSTKVIHLPNYLLKNYDCYFLSTVNVIFTG